MITIPCTFGQACGEYPDAVEIEDLENRIKIYADAVKWEDPFLTFDLVAGYKIDVGFLARIESVESAMILTLEQPGLGASGILQLGTPGETPPFPNLTGEPLSADEGKCFMFMTQPLHISCEPAASQEEAPLFIRVSLLPLISNVITIPLNTVKPI